MQDNYDKTLQKVIGQIIRRERRKRKLRFTIFCYENDIPKTNLYMLETGQSNVGVTTLFKVLSLMGISFKDFGKMLDEELSKLNADIKK